MSMQFQLCMMNKLMRDLLYNTVPIVNNTDLPPLKYIKEDEGIGDSEERA